MSPSPKEIWPMFERDALLIRTGRIISGAVETYNRVFPSQRVGDWRVVSFVVEPGEAELIHPLLLCKDQVYGDLTLRALGGFPERPCLAGAELWGAEEETLEVFWGPIIRERRYSRVAGKHLPTGQNDNCFLPFRKEWPYFTGGAEEDLRTLMLGAPDNDCLRLLMGVERATGIR